MTVTRDALPPRDQRAFDSIVDGLTGHGWARADAVAQVASIFVPEAETSKPERDRGARE